jgi:RecB family exonuclease
LPSRWLLPTLRHHSGDPSLAATQWAMAGIGASSGEWLSTSHSYAGSLLTTGIPSTSQEWRVRAVAARKYPGDDILAASKAMTRGRESDGFTRFDGNLSGAAGLPDFADGTRMVSPTQLERYAICPHEYFVRRMLHVEPVELPEQEVEISVLDIGNLIHESFDDLISGCAERGELPAYGQPWSEPQRQRLAVIASARADTFEAEGRTGHPLLWARTRPSLLATLDWMLDNDNQWRAGQDARVLASELSFGMHGEPEVQIRIDGGTVRFRGSADKVDLRRDGTLLVTDLKTGGIRAFKDLSESNPVAGGEKLQLPVYAHAARARFGDPGTPVEAMYWFVRRDRGKRVQVPLTGIVEQTYAETVGLITRSIAHGMFPARAPAEPDFRWVKCPYCNPDGLGHSEARRRWEAKRLAPELVGYTALVEPEALTEAPAQPTGKSDDTESGTESDTDSGSDAGGGAG